jgi:hypothetical protein
MLTLRDVYSEIYKIYQSVLNMNYNISLLKIYKFDVEYINT